MTNSVQLIEPSLRQTDKMRARRRRSFWRKFFLCVIVVLLVGFSTLCFVSGSITNACRLMGLGVGFVKDRVCQTPPFHGRKQVNILLLGTDVSFGESSRTDTIKLISVDLDKQRIGMLSIPRDTWVALPNHRMGRINGAHQLGGDDRAKCVSMAETTVQDLLTDLSGQPVKIDYYVRVQTDGFVKIVTALGGIDINVEKRMRYDDPSQNLHIDLEPGLQHLDGTQAMGYVRFRHDAEGDYGRIRRQDQFIRTLAAQLRSPEKSHKLKVLGSLLDMVSTDLSANDVLALKRIIDKVGMDGLETAQLPTVPTYKGAASVVEVRDREAALQTVNEVLHGARPTVAILNGTTRRGLARDASERVDAATFNVVGLGTTETPAATSIVIASAEHRQEASRLATQLGLTAPVDTKSAPPQTAAAKPEIPETPAQITVVLGDDYQMPVAMTSSSRGL